MEGQILPALDPLSFFTGSATVTFHSYSGCYLFFTPYYLCIFSISLFAKGINLGCFIYSHIVQFKEKRQGGRGVSGFHTVT